MSNKENLKKGVSQGSVLGLILLLLKINDSSTVGVVASIVASCIDDLGSIPSLAQMQSVTTAEDAVPSLHTCIR